MKEKIRSDRGWLGNLVTRTVVLEGTNFKVLASRTLYTCTAFSYATLDSISGLNSREKMNIRREEGVYIGQRVQRVSAHLGFERTRPALRLNDGLGSSPNAWKKVLILVLCPIKDEGGRWIKIDSSVHYQGQHSPERERENEDQKHREREREREQKTLGKKAKRYTPEIVRSWAFVA